MPPENRAELLVNDTLLAVRSPALKMAPPSRLAVLLRKLLLASTVRVPVFQMAPPPWSAVVSVALLALNVQLLSVAEPSVAMAPPSTEKLLANNAPWTVRLP